jgi:hypothetical protein
MVVAINAVAAFTSELSESDKDREMTQSPQQPLLSRCRKRVREDQRDTRLHAVRRSSFIDLCTEACCRAGYELAAADDVDKYQGQCGENDRGENGRVDGELSLEGPQ